MDIVISERLRPYTHFSASYVILPKTSFRLKIFPARIEIDDLSCYPEKPLCRISLTFAKVDLLEHFLVQQDLEKACVFISGKMGKEIVNFSISSQEDRKGITLSFKRVIGTFVSLTCSGKWSDNQTFTLNKGECISIGEMGASSSIGIESAAFLPQIDRLSLGNNKQQDFDLIFRRGDFKEIFPLWHRLGQLIPNNWPPTSCGTASLLKECEKAIRASAKEHILKHFKRLFVAGFESTLSPSLLDTHYNGFPLPFVETAASPLVLLTEGAKLIRSLFVQEAENTLYILPSLPPEFHAGRLLNVKCELGFLSLEWTKKEIRRIKFYAVKDGLLNFHFASHEKSFAFWSCNGTTSHCQLTKMSIEVMANHCYWLYNFKR